MEIRRVLPEDLTITIFVDEIELSIRLSSAIAKIQKELEEYSETELEQDIEREMKKIKG